MRQVICIVLLARSKPNMLQDQHKDLWKGANRKFSKIPWHKIEAQRHNAERTPDQQVHLDRPHCFLTLHITLSPSLQTLQFQKQYFWESLTACCFKMYGLATAVYQDIVGQGSCLGHTWISHMIGLAHAKHFLNGHEGESKLPSQQLLCAAGKAAKWR